MKILVTGGTGYIGSHTCVELLSENHEVVIIDNLSNSEASVVDSIEKISNKKVAFYKGDVENRDLLRKIFSENQIDAVIHFAGFKFVGESVKEPLKYYQNNLESSIALFAIMQEFNCKSIVFSSSCTVYGSPKVLPIREDSELNTINPYGTTKLTIENILKDIYKADNEWSIAILRYFNPIGAHESKLLFENPKGIPNTLMPYIVKVAKGELKELKVFGGDYNTKDGTCIRDYIHIVDLAKGHLLALDKIHNSHKIDCYNLGIGSGCSVLEIINTFEKVNNVKIPYTIVDRREGDAECVYADPSYAMKELNFKTTKTLEDMCKDAYLI